jgi:hypothetical protein
VKQHIRLKLKKPVAISITIPSWQEVARGKVTAPVTIHPAIDKLLTYYQCPVKVTQEYQSTNAPVSDHWTQPELETGLNRIYRLIAKYPDPVPTKLITALSHHPLVEEVKVGDIAQTVLPVMKTISMSMNLGARSRRAIYLDQAHQYCQGDPAVMVAVLDTGLEVTHPEFQENVVPGYDFVNIIDGADQFLGDYLGYDKDPEDEVGHGTHVAGIIAARGTTMPSGVVPRCKLLPVRVLGGMKRGSNRVGAGLVDNINSGIKWAVDQGADVINMSLGIQRTGDSLPHAEVVEYARRKGVTLVAASGNDGQQAYYYPGSLPHPITVGAVNAQGNVAPYSTYGTQVDLVAPGTNIYSTYLNGGYAFSTGTSHAAPFVAGAVALLKSYAWQKTGERLSDAQVKYLLKHTADKLDTGFKHPKAGFGRLNVVDALCLLDAKLNS